MNDIFENWLASEAGKSLLAAERANIQKFMRQVAGPVVVQLGEFGGHELVREYGFPVSVIVSGSKSDGVSELSRVAAAAESLPFQDAQISSIICPHVLEYSADPHQVLREVKRVLRPEGHVLLTGFNPWSLLGIGSSFRRRAPWHGRSISFFRLSDWLRLLELEITGSAMFFYSLGFKSASAGRLSQVLNAAGDRWWPMLGGVYIVVARKREPGMTLVGRKITSSLRPKRIRSQPLVRRNEYSPGEKP